MRRGKPEPVLRHFVLLFLFPLLLAAQSDPIWPEVDSDLPADPGLRQAQLANGFRYALLRNAEPKDRVSLRLVVRAGSLHERDDERGLAHFLEHMVFRGTKRHPNGTLTAELQKLGIGFGPDNTAFTLPDYTIYHLELPDTRDATLRQALEVFREYAQEVTFDPGLIERERGVVLSELETRNTPGDRAGRANLAFLFPQARQVARVPIGTADAIRSFTREQFVAFYDAWYRPERMALVIVGDLDPTKVEPAIADVFGEMRARGLARNDVIATIPAEASPSGILVFADPGMIGATCSLQHPFPEPRAPDTQARRVRQLHRALAFAMFERRVTRLAGTSTEGFVAPDASIEHPVAGWALASFGVSGTIADWKKFMTQVEQEHRRAFFFGFHPGELAAVRRAFVTGYDEAVRTRPTRPSPWLAGGIVEALVHGHVFTTPAAVKEDLALALADATPAQCLAAFREAWSRQAPHVFVATHPQFAVEPQAIANAMNESRQVTVEPFPEIGTPEFAYTDFGPPAAAIRTRHVADLDVDQAEFGNGVRLNFKPTPFEADTVHLYLRVGRGRQSQPPGKIGLDLLANHLVPQGGVGRHTYQEIQDICADHAVSVNFFTEDDAFAVNARCARRDLLFCLQMIAAHLEDPGFRPEALRQIHAHFGSMYSSLSASAGGPISANAERVFANDDPRFAVPAPEELYARTVEEAAAWLRPELKHGAIELGIVGDTTWEEAAGVVAQTLAALPARKPFADVRPRALALAKPKRPAYLFTTPPQLRQVALAWLCPAPDVADIYRERRCALLAELVTDRLRVRLREELGATYHCTADFVRHDSFANMSYFLVYAEVSASQAEQAADVLRRELMALRKGRFSEEEFERVKKPFLRSREDDLRTNSYWGHTVLRDAQQNPLRLVAARDRAIDTPRITRREIAQLARRYFDVKQSFHFVAFPASAGPTVTAFGALAPHASD